MMRIIKSVVGGIGSGKVRYPKMANVLSLTAAIKCSHPTKQAKLMTSKNLKISMMSISNLEATSSK